MNLKKRAKTDFLVVHCSATTPNQDIGATEIDQWHRKKGWVCIGYHFVIRRDGTVENGRDHDEVGAHVEGHNSNSIGICLIGGLDSKLKPTNNFTKQQFDALAGLLRNLQTQYPAAEICGHRDFAGVKKDCPCFDVREWTKESL